ncbi:hypothetical protein [Pleionea sediminis]|uniref:hypothetical protein n=1 Tax=Pleionea sediminis TaxID=2569479 RepID=UPI0011870B20|nr:hypothetical protein [Pleionea sediminis]
MTQIDNTGQQELELIRRKRKALEQLIRFAKQIVRQESAMQDVLQLAKPSQRISKQCYRYLKVLNKKETALTTPEIEQQLSKLDVIVSKQVAKLFSLSYGAIKNISDESLEIELKKIKTLLDGFKQRTELAVALRLVLHERGVVTQRLVLPIPQEALYSKIDQLKEEETQVREQVRLKIESIIDDIKVMRQSEALPESMKNELKTIHQVMLNNLSHIKSGKKIEDMPVNFEVIDMGEELSSSVNEPTKISVDNGAVVKEDNLKEEKKTSQSPSDDPLSTVSRVLEVDTHQSNKLSWWKKLLRIFKG